MALLSLVPGPHMAQTVYWAYSFCKN